MKFLNVDDSLAHVIVNFVTNSLHKFVFALLPDIWDESLQIIFPLKHLEHTVLFELRSMLVVDNHLLNSP